MRSGLADLGTGPRALAGPLSRPVVWRALDGLIGVMMLVLAMRLVRGG